MSDDSSKTSGDAGDGPQPSASSLQAIARSGYRYININTEIIDQDMLNYNPQKVDFLGAYLPFMEDAIGFEDVDLLNEGGRHEQH